MECAKVKLSDDEEKEKKERVIGSPSVIGRITAQVQLHHTS